MNTKKHDSPSREWLKTTKQDRAIRSYMLGVLHECRNDYAKRGHQCQGVAIGYHGSIIKVCDDNGAAEWDVTLYRPFYHRNFGCSQAVSCIAEMAALRFQHCHPDMRPSNQDVENMIDSYEALP
jgi:hypothetical protein